MNFMDLSADLMDHWTNFTYPFADSTYHYAYFIDPWAKLRDNILILQTYIYQFHGPFRLSA